MAKKNLTRDDLHAIYVALQEQVEKWHKYVEMGDPKPEWKAFDRQQLARYQAVRNKVEGMLHDAS